MFSHVKCLICVEKLVCGECFRLGSRIDRLLFDLFLFNYINCKVMCRFNRISMCISIVSFGRD